VETGNKEIQ